MVAMETMLLLSALPLANMLKLWTKKRVGGAKRRDVEQALFNYTKVYYNRVG